MPHLYQTEFDWIKQINLSGETVYSRENRTEYTDNVIDSHYIMFNYSKCFSGISYRFINSLDDINNRNIITGDGNSLYHRLNEYDIIDDFLYNYTTVDLSANYNVNTSQTYYIIDQIKLKPTHRVLLYNQINSTQNGIYIVDNNYNLTFSDELNNAEHYMTYCKAGTNFDKIFYLLPTSSNTFSHTITDPVIFNTGNTLILKSIIDYDILTTGQTSLDCAKILFSDYGYARKQLSKNYDLYNPIIFTGSTIYDITPFQIEYKNNIVQIQVNNVKSKIFTGYTFLTYPAIYNESGQTHVLVDTAIGKNIGDYINLQILYPNNNIYLECNTFIKSFDTTTSGVSLKISDIITSDILNLPCISLTGVTGMIYKVRNWQYCKSNLTDFDLCVNNQWLSDFYSTSLTGSNLPYTITTKENSEFKYWNYDLLSFSANTWNQKFSTYNNYIAYDLIIFLQRINSGFTTSYSVFNSYTLTAFTYTISGDTIFIIPNNSADTSNFVKYSYIDYTTGTSFNQYSLILDVTDKYILISSPKNFTYAGEYIKNVETLGEISSILTDTFTNIDYSYYKRLNIEMIKKIGAAYGEILQNNTGITNNITGIIYLDNAGKPIFKIYNENDNLLYYEPTEILFIGIDKKTRFPIRIKNENFSYEN